MASGFWGVTGFFIILEVALALGVQFSPTKKDDKQYVAVFLAMHPVITGACKLTRSPALLD